MQHTVTNRTFVIYTCTPIVGCTFLIVQLANVPSLVDFFNLGILILCITLASFSKYTSVVQALICGYLTGSLQGFEAEIADAKEGVLSITLTSLVLSSLLITINFNFAKKNFIKVFIIVFIPPIFTLISIILGEYTFVVSEFKKFILFVTYFILAISIKVSNKNLILQAVGVTIIFVSISSIISNHLFGIGFVYGSIVYPIIPATILLIPLIYLLYGLPTYRYYIIFIIILLATGQLQPSAKLLIILLVVIIMELRKLNIWKSTNILILMCILAVSASAFDTNMNHKISSLLSAGNAIYELSTFGTIRDAKVFFHTSVGNIIAEFITIILTIAKNYGAPAGAGMAAVDWLGYLSMANDAAYAESSTPESVYPLHLGVFYLFMWYGPLMIVFKDYRLYELYFFIFIIFAAASPSLLMLSAILTKDERFHIKPSRRKDVVRLP